MKEGIKNHLNHNTRTVIYQMIDFLFAFLLFMCVSGGFGFLAGYLAGRACERTELKKVIERWYENPNEVIVDTDLVYYIGKEKE